MNTIIRHAVSCGLGVIMFFCGVSPASSATPGQVVPDIFPPITSHQLDPSIYVDISGFAKVAEIIHLFEQDAPADHPVASVQTGVSNAKDPLPQIDVSVPLQRDRGSISSEAISECRMPKASKTIYNFGVATESECTCELYKRSPLVKVNGATGKDFHWVKTCKKSRYKVSLITK